MGSSRTDLVRIIVCFGDITGFSDFFEEVTNYEKELQPFLEKYDLYVRTSEKETGIKYKNAGDGLMVTYELEEGKESASATSLLLSLWGLLKCVEKLIEKKTGPRPEGFRVVGASGYVLKTPQRGREPILRGKHMNLAHKALELARGVGMLVHESFKNLVSQEDKSKHGISFYPFTPPPRLPRGISSMESKKFFIVKIERRKCRNG